MNKVVVRFRDGRVLKGVSLDLGKPLFHLRPAAGGKALEIRLDDLKAIFFVRSFDGNAGRHEIRVPDPEDPRGRAWRRSFPTPSGLPWRSGSRLAARCFCRKEGRGPDCRLLYRARFTVMHQGKEGKMVGGQNRRQE